MQGAAPRSALLWPTLASSPTLANNEVKIMNKGTFGCNGLVVLDLSGASGLGFFRRVSQRGVTRNCAVFFPAAIVSAICSSMLLLVMVMVM